MEKDYLDKCIEKLNNATLEEIERMKQIYEEENRYPTNEKSEWEFILPKD